MALLVAGGLLAAPVVGAEEVHLAKVPVLIEVLQPLRFG